MTFLPTRRAPVRAYPGWLERGVKRSAVRARKFDGFPIVLDRSGQAVHGLATNMTAADIQTVTPGSQGLVFDGVNESVDAGLVLAFERTDSFSMTFYAKWTSVATMALIGKNAPLGEPAYLVWSDAGKLYVGLTCVWGAGNRLTLSTNSTFNDDVWHHVAITYAGTSLASGVKVYVDGALQAVTVLVDGLVGTILNGGKFMLAARDMVGSAIPFAGSMSDAAVWNKVLSQTEVAEVYNQGRPVNLKAASSAANLKAWWRMGERFSLAASSVLDFSGSGYHGTQQNMEITDVVSRTTYGQSLAFDGVSKYVLLGDVLSLERTNPFSVFCWAKTVAVANGMLLGRALTPSGRGWCFIVDSTGKPYVDLVSSFLANNYIQVGTTAISINNGAWHRLGFTYDGSSGAGGVVIYVDSAAAATTVYRDSLTSSIQGSDPLTMGMRYSHPTPYSYNGSLYGVTVWNRVLTVAEVLEEYNNAVPVNPRNLSTANNLLGWWAVGPSVP